VALAISAKVSWIHTWKVGISVGHSKFPSMDFVRRFCRFSLVDGRDHPRVATLHQLKLISNCCACAEEEIGNGTKKSQKRGDKTTKQAISISHQRRTTKRTTHAPGCENCDVGGFDTGICLLLKKKGSLDHFQVALTPMSSPPATPVKRRSRVVYVPDFAA